MPRPEVVHSQQQKQYEALIKTSEGSMQFQWYIPHDVLKIHKLEKWFPRDPQVTLFYPQLSKTLQDIIAHSTFLQTAAERSGGVPIDAIRTSLISLGNFSYVVFFESIAHESSDYFVAHLSRAKETTDLGQKVPEDAKALHTAAIGLRHLPEAVLPRFHIAEPFAEGVTERGYPFYLQSYVNGGELVLDAVNLKSNQHGIKDVQLPFFCDKELGVAWSVSTQQNILAELLERDKRPARSFEEIIAASRTYRLEKEKLAHLLRGHAFIYATTGGMFPTELKLTGGTHLIENSKTDPDITVVSFEGPLESMTVDEWCTRIGELSVQSPRDAQYTIPPFSQFSKSHVKEILNEAVTTVNRQ